MIRFLKKRVNFRSCFCGHSFAMWYV